MILLTSPWPGSLFAFRRVWPVLAPTARLVAVDMPGFGHSEGRPEVLTPSAMAEFLAASSGSSAARPGYPHLVAPDVGASQFLAALHPGSIRSVVAGGGGASHPLEVTGARVDIIPHRASTCSPVRTSAPRSGPPSTVSASGRSAGCVGGLRLRLREQPVPESTRYVRAYPDELPVPCDLRSAVPVPVRVFAAAHDPLIAVCNGQHLAERIPGSLPSILPAGHFGGERPHRGRAHG